MRITAQPLWGNAFLQPARSNPQVGFCILEPQCLPSRRCCSANPPPSMPLNLLRDRIQVLPDPVRDDVSSAGILIAASKGIVDSQKQFGRKGTVVAVGEDIDADQLKVGDRILWGEFLFPEYRESGEKYLILQDKDITAVLEDE